MSFYSKEDIEQLGFKYVGSNVKISTNARFYGIGNISIGNNSRIDDFCVLSISDNAEIIIGSNVHIAIYSSLIGKENIILHDYVNLSSRVSLYSSSDDFSGNFMTNPTVEESYTNVSSKSIVLDKHVVVGSGSVILPGVELSEGVAVGALSLVNKSFSENLIVAGVPVKVIRNRATNYKELEKKHKGFK